MYYMWGKLELYGFWQLVKQQFAVLTWAGYDLATPRQLSLFGFAHDSMSNLPSCIHVAELSAACNG